MRLFKLTTVLFVGMAMMLSACADKRGFRSRIPVVEPSIVDLAPASENVQPEETLVPEEQSPEEGDSNSELSEPAVIEEGSEDGEETGERVEHGELSPISEEAIDQSVRDQQALLGAAQNELQRDQGLAPLSREDQAFTAEAAELFTAEILNQEVTPDLIQQSLSQNFNPALSKNIMGMSVRRVVQVAPTADSAGIYDVAVDFGLKWMDAETGATNIDHMVSSFQLQYPHQNGSGVVEASIAFAQELDSEDGGRVENMVLYATCAAENCAELLVLIRMRDPRPGYEGQENIAAYQFGENLADPEMMIIQRTSVGIDNFLNFEEVQEQILAAAEAAEAAEATEEESAETMVDDGSQPVDEMATQEESSEGQTVELDASEESTEEDSEEPSEEANEEATSEEDSAQSEMTASDRVRQAGAEANADQQEEQQQETRTETVNRGNGIRTYKGGFIE